nr:hypothetical protein CFP56_59655 [Quercus suber]
MAPIKTWAWSLPDPPSQIAIQASSTSALEKSRKRQSRAEQSSTDASRPSADLTALPVQHDQRSPERDRPDLPKITRQSNGLPLESFRYSLFRGRKKGRALSTTTPVGSTQSPPLRPPRPSLQETRSPTLLQQDRYENEEDCKCSLLPLTGVRRPSKKRPPPLNAVDAHTAVEQLAPVVVSPQTSKHARLQGIQVGYAVETRAVNLPKLSGPPSPYSPTESVENGMSSSSLRRSGNKILLPKGADSILVPEHAIQDFPATPTVRLPSHARRKSSLSSNGSSSPHQNMQMSTPAFDIPSPSGKAPCRNRAASAASAKSRMTIPLVPVPEEEPVPLAGETRSDRGIIDRSKLPLPPLPVPKSSTSQLSIRSAEKYAEDPNPRQRSASSSGKAAKDEFLASDSSLGSLSAPLATKAFLAMLEQTAPTPSRVTEAHKNLSSTRVKTKGSLPAKSWEDDIDFCYEQAAESSCDFDWKSNTSQRPSPHLLVVDTQAVRAFADPWIMTSPTSQDLGSPSLSESSSSMRRSISGRAHYRRGLLVGHHAFPTRHKHFGDVTNSNTVEPLIPKHQFSVTTEGQESSSAFRATKLDQLSKRHAPIAALNLTDLSGQIDYLSDPESCDWKRRISSSYGSCRSSLRRSRTEPAGETARWSSTSSSSVPDLLRSERKSDNSLHDQFSFCDLLDAHPNSAAAGLEDTGLHQRSHSPESDQRFQHGPQNPSDRAIWQNAGRAAQRGKLDRNSQSAPAIPAMSSRRALRSPFSREAPALQRLPHQDFEDWI